MQRFIQSFWLLSFENLFLLHVKIIRQDVVHMFECAPANFSIDQLSLSE